MDETGSAAVMGTEAGEERLARQLARGVARALADHGISSLTEFSLRSGRRVDVIGLDAKGRITIVEIKSSLEDFRSDAKWPEYLDYCDAFYFAVPEHFPQEIIPDAAGLMVADAYGAAILRESPELPLNGTRRRTLLLRFAVAAAKRLMTLTNPR